jgi:polyhydroxyalkanoate synthesis regulator phasin
MPVRQATLDAERKETRRLQDELADALKDVAELTNLTTRQAQKITDVQSVLLATHNDREALRDRVEQLEQQVAVRDLTHRGLAEERDAALETVGILATDGDTDVLRRVVVDHIATNLRSTSPAAADLARALQSELWLAGVGVDADVKTALDGAP